ncbi:hypothetical protein F8D52_13750 [Chryseobacterium viscerum]|uniref:DUF3592 domain-containing protein n=2 Tax=Chryseobacterium viscerum TaxID=1037377 RepID=A0A5N4BP81_9FLAO|nr:hypothetical protein F8D52_13750 [Chryseobacterium viscerum]
MVQFLFKNKISTLGTFLIIGSISLIFYNIYKSKNFSIITDSSQNVYIEGEKQKGEFKYGETNLNVLYLYIELKSISQRFYIYENVGNNNDSSYLNNIRDNILKGTKIKIWVDNDEFKNYKDVEIQKLEIGSTIFYNFFNYQYIFIAIISGIILLIISKKYSNT